MSVFEDRLVNPDFPGRAGRITSVLENLTPEQRYRMAELVPEGIPRLRILCNRVVIVVTGSDPNVVSQNQIDQLLGPLAEIESHMNAYESDGDDGHIATIFVNLCDQLVVALSTWNASDPVTVNLSEVSEGFREALATRVEPLITTAAEINGQYISLKSQLDEAQLRLDQMISENNANIESLISIQATRVEDIRANIDSQLPRIDQTLASMQEDFSKGQTARLEEAAQLKTNNEETIRTSEVEYKKRADRLIDQIIDGLKAAQALVGTIGVTGTAAAYRDEAEAQCNIANRWRMIATVTGAIAGAVLVIFLFVNAKEDTAQAITHVFSGIAVFGFAGYAAQQSSIHRKREEGARRTALKLIAFPPFVAPLSPDDQRETRKALVESLFIDSSIESDESGTISASQVSTLGQLVDIVVKAAKKN